MVELLDYTDEELKSLIEEIQEGKIVLLIPRRSGKKTLMERIKKLMVNQVG